MFVAFELKKTLGEIHDMPLDELADWLAFFNVKTKMREDARKQQQRR